MLSLDATQLAIIASDHKKVSWLFVVTDSAGPTVFRWSTVTRSYDGDDYTFKIIPSSFKGITLNRGKSEISIQAPNDLSFDVLNKDNVLTASNFVDGSVTVYLVVSDGTDEETICTWKFNIKQCDAAYQKLHFVCEDFVQKYLEGDYPNTKLIKDILLSTDTDLDDNICVPVPLGECYVPLRSLYIEDGRYYLLGPSGETYDIQKVRSPRSLGKSEWDLIASGEIPASGEYNAHQSMKTIGTDGWNVFQPIIADADGDGAADACGLWKEGDHFLDMPTQFSRSDTADKTNPANAIEFVLKDLGIPSGELDIGVGSSFETASGEYSGWGLEFNGAFFYKQPRQKVLSQLLSMCHSTLRVTDKIELHVLSKTSQKNITKADVIRTQEVGEGTFKRTTTMQDQPDSGHIAFQEVDESQDEFLKALVPAKDTTNNISSEILEIPFVQDSQDAQRIGTLRYQRKFLKDGDDSFTGKGTLLAVQPDDVITPSGEADYGGTHDILVDQMTITRDLSTVFQCVRFKEDLDDWDDLTPDAITIVSGETGDYWAPVVSGPAGAGASSGYAPSVIPGPLVVGVPPTDYILIDPASQKIESSNYVAGSAGKGFKLDPNLLEVGNIACRGIIRTAVFQKDVVSAIGGSFLVRPADVLSVDMTSDD